MCSHVVYIHADWLEDRWYQYVVGYYGFCTWYPVTVADLGPLSVACVYQADLQLFHRHGLGLTLSPTQVYENYCKDLKISQYFHCSYEQYHIIDALSDYAKVNSECDSSESQGKSNDPMQSCIPAENVEMYGEAVSSYTLSNEQENPLVRRVRSGSPNKASNKINLVDKYFPDKKTGFFHCRRIRLISFHWSCWPGNLH